MIKAQKKRSVSGVLLTGVMTISGLILVGWMVDQYSANDTGEVVTCVVERVDISELLEAGQVKRLHTHVSSVSCGPNLQRIPLMKQIAQAELNQLRAGSSVRCKEFRTSYSGQSLIRGCAIAS